MLIGDASVDILADIDDRISSCTSGMQLKKVFKLLPYPGVQSRQLYCFEGEVAIKFRLLPRHMTELAGMHFFNNLARTDIVLYSLKAEDFEAAARSIVDVTSWMDWRTFAAKSMALWFPEEVKMLKWLFVAGARCRLLVATTASTVWSNLVLKRRDAILTKVKGSISFESFMDLHNSPFSESTELFLKEAVEKAVEKSSRVLHDRVIQKAVSAENLAQEATKHLHFS